MNLEVVNLRNIDRKKVKKTPEAVNQVLSRIHAESITEAKVLILVEGNVVSELLGEKRSKNENNKIPSWKRRKQTRVAKVKKTCGAISRVEQKQTVKNRVKADLDSTM